MPRVTAYRFAGNKASWQLVERLHFRHVLHSVRDSLHRCGQWLESFSYALLADEWRTSRTITETQTICPASQEA